MNVTFRMGHVICSCASHFILDDEKGEENMRMGALRCFVQLFATPWTVAHQAPLSMGFSRQGY